MLGYQKDGARKLTWKFSAVKDEGFNIEVMDLIFIKYALNTL
jgi:hypothetical protein|tara:strand:+ start:595 stop:720 length:126 start_codon:yes stop_codon:yes gene_type:complete